MPSTQQVLTNLPLFLSVHSIATCFGYMAIIRQYKYSTILTVIIQHATDPLSDSRVLHPVACVINFTVNAVYAASFYQSSCSDFG